MSAIKQLSLILSDEVERRYGIASSETTRSKIEELLLSEKESWKIERYFELVKEASATEEWKKILEKITIHESYFQRNLNILNSAAVVIDNILKKKQSIRIWSVPCSTGEEAYDLAFLAIESLYKSKYGTNVFSDQMLNALNLDDMYVYATDVSENCLLKAKQGYYDTLTMGSMRKIDPIKKKYFFIEKDKGVEVKAFIKKRVKFVAANVFSPPLQTDFDLIMCRNMLIYFSDEKRKECQENLAQSLVGGGYLFLGSVDSFLLNPNQFIQHSDGSSIWYEKKEE